VSSTERFARVSNPAVKFAYNIRMSLENSISGRHQSYVKPLQSPVGTFPYIAPELLETKPYNEMVDVYSFSMVLWHVLTRQPPWAGLTNSVFNAKFVCTCVMLVCLLTLLFFRGESSCCPLLFVFISSS
jgi:serine/threonine protein kinase